MNTHPLDGIGSVVTAQPQSVTNEPSSLIKAEIEWEGDDISHRDVSLQPLLGGLEVLEDVDILVIKQSRDLKEALTGVNRSNRYDVYNGDGRKLFFAGETTDMSKLCCGGPQRPFEITIIDPRKRKIIMKIKRPHDCLLYCSACLYCCGTLGGEVSVSLKDDTKLGTMTHAFMCYQVGYNIVDEHGETVMKIGGPICGDCTCCMQCYEPCCVREFPIYLNNGQQIGKIKKKVSDLKEFTTNADNFGITFPMDLDIRWKALLLSATFLIDFMYFEI